MIDIDLVRRKLSHLNLYLDKLAPLLKHSFHEYLSDFYLKMSTERLVQLIVECASDINNHVVAELGERPPEDYTSSFVRAAEVGMISRELAARIKGAGGMRNILVHEYMDVDDEKVYQVLPSALSDFKTYLKEVDAFLDQLKQT